MYDLQKLKKKDFPDLRSFNGTTLPKLLPLIHMDDVNIRNPNFIFAKKNNLHLFWMYLTENMLNQWAQQVIASGEFQEKIAWFDIDDFIMPINILNTELDDIYRLYPDLKSEHSYTITINYHIKSNLKSMFIDFFNKHLEIIQFSPKVIKILEQDISDIYPQVNLLREWFKKTNNENRDLLIENRLEVGNYYFNHLVADYRFTLPLKRELSLLQHMTLDELCKGLPSYIPSDEIHEKDRLSNALLYLKKDPFRFFELYNIDEINKIKGLLNTIKMLGRHPSNITKNEIFDLLSKEFTITGLDII